MKLTLFWISLSMENTNRRLLVINYVFCFTSTTNSYGHFRTVSCQPHYSWAGLDLLSGKLVLSANTFASNWKKISNQWKGGMAIEKISWSMSTNVSSHTRNRTWYLLLLSQTLPTALRGPAPGIDPGTPGSLFGRATNCATQKATIVVFVCKNGGTNMELYPFTLKTLCFVFSGWHNKFHWKGLPMATI